MVQHEHKLGLDALAAHGSARALTELDHISRKMKFKSLKNGAAQRVAELPTVSGSIENSWPTGSFLISI